MGGRLFLLVCRGWQFNARSRYSWTPDQARSRFYCYYTCSCSLKPTNTAIPVFVLKVQPVLPEPVRPKQAQGIITLPNIPTLPVFVRETIIMNANDQYKACIEACLKCASICNQCAVACTYEKDVTMMAACIRLDMECAALCYATAQLMSMGGSQAARLAGICADLCEACAAECGKHHHEHCVLCAQACKACAEECRKINNSGQKM